jgi:hypothetical protein
VKIKVVPIASFNIFTDVKFQRMKLVGYEITFYASNVDIGNSIKKCNVLSIEEERKMLGQAICLPTSPTSLNLQFDYFFIKIFFI